LKKAEERRENAIKHERQMDKLARQKIIDEENEMRKKKFENQLQERQAAIDKLKEENKGIKLIEVSARECKPYRFCEDRMYKILDPKYKFIGIYNNGQVRNIKHIQSEIKDQSEVFEFEYDVLTLQNNVFVPGNKKKFYFEKYLQMGGNAINKKIDIPKPEIEPLLPPARTAKTTVLIDGSLDEDLEINHCNDIKRPRVATSAMMTASAEIVGWEKAKKTCARFAAIASERDNKDTFVSYNKFAVLKLHQSSWNLNKYVKNDSKITQINEGTKPDLKSNSTYDTVENVVLYRDGKKMTKKELKERRREMIVHKQKTKKHQPVSIEKRLSFREVVLMILNNKFLKEIKVKQSKFIDDAAIDEFLQTGSLSKKVTGLSKGPRSIAVRIIRSFYLSRMS